MLNRDPETNPADGTTAAAWPSQRHAWTALVLLMAAIMVSVMDRGIINLMVQPIKAHYGLTDTQFGALQGIAFGTFYVLASIPLGILADRHQRRLVVGIGVAIFSLFALATGFARSYGQLFLARMGVGFGEASVSPSGYSLISDYFPPDKMGRAAGLFGVAQYVGASLSLVLGGVLIGSFDRLAKTGAGVPFGLDPWQATIACIALPGLVLAPFLLLMREPPRRGLARGGRRLGLGETLRELGQRRLFLLTIIAAMSMGSIMTNAVGAWTPALFIRVYGWNAQETGFWLGVMILVGAVIGGYFGGWVTDRMTRHNRLDAPLKVAAISFLGAGIVGVAAPLMPTGALAMFLTLLLFLLKPMAFILAPLSLQLVIPNQLRTTTTAVYFTTLNLLGLLIGPVSVGLLTDQLFPGPTGVRYSIALITAVTVPIMVVLMLVAVAPFRGLREQMQASAA